MKSLVIFLFFIPFAFFSQNGLTLHLGCFKPGDTISQQDLNNINELRLFDYSKEKQDANLKDWELEISGYKASCKPDQNAPYKLTTDALGRLYIKANGPPVKIVFKNIKITRTKGSTEVESSDMSGEVVYYIAKMAKECSVSEIIGNKSDNNKNVTYKGKLLMGKIQKEPLANQKVILKDAKNKEIQSTTTDKYGDFNFEKVETTNSYDIEVPNPSVKIKDDQLYIAKQDGSIIKSLEKKGNSFVYKLLPIELSRLSEEKIDDTDLTLKNFSKSKDKVITVTKNINYELNSSDLNAESKLVLDKLITMMKDNKALKLSIISHTDAQGDDKSNQALSEKRAGKMLSIFVSKGIAKERLIAKGLGETKILNRCGNGVDCSEIEHRFNRRTEFVFSKQ